MVRNVAREIAIHLAYELSFTDRTVEELLDQRLTAESFASLSGEDAIYAETPNEKQAVYIVGCHRRGEHAAELDGYISKYAVAGDFARIPLVGSAIMRVVHVRDFVHAESPRARPSTRPWKFGQEV